MTPKTTEQIDSPAWNASCAEHHFGVWMIESDWFRKAVAAVRGGTWHPVRQDTIVPAAEPQRRRSYMVAKGGMAVIPIAGPMMKARSKFGGTSTVDTRTQIREAVNDDSVSSILVLIDSPGGTVAGTEALAQDVANADRKKPTYAHIEDCGASAAYYVASQARRITASPTSLVGSLGTMMALDDTTKKNEMAGVKTFLVSNGGMKGAGTDGTEITVEQLDYFQGIVDSATAHFMAAVGRGRNLKQAALDKLFDGRVHDALQAKALGLIDDVVPLDAAVSAILADLEIEEDDLSNKKSRRGAISTAVAELNATAAMQAPHEVGEKMVALVNTIALSETITKAPEVSTTSVEPSPAINKEVSPMSETATQQATPAQIPAPANTGISQGNTQSETARLTDAAISSFIEKGKIVGRGEGRNVLMDEIRAIVATCPGRPQTAINAILAGQNATTVKLIVDAEVNAEIAGNKRAQEQDLEIAKLRADQARLMELNTIGGHPGVKASVFAPAQQQTTAAATGLEPKAQAQLEWDSDPMLRANNGGEAGKKTWLLFRANELSGLVRVLKTA